MVEGLASQRGETIVSHGAAAANAVGRIAQVPMRAVDLTSDPSFRLKLGAQTVEFRHAPRWQLIRAIAGDLAAAGHWAACLAGHSPGRRRAGVHRLRAVGSREWDMCPRRSCSSSERDPRLDAAGFADSAMADTALAKSVADHKSVFFAAKSPAGEPIDSHNQRPSARLQSLHRKPLKERERHHGYDTANYHTHLQGVAGRASSALFLFCIFQSAAHPRAFLFLEFP